MSFITRTFKSVEQSGVYKAHHWVCFSIYFYSCTIFKSRCCHACWLWYSVQNASRLEHNQACCHRFTCAVVRLIDPVHLQPELNPTIIHWFSSFATRLALMAGKVGMRKAWHRSPPSGCPVHSRLEAMFHFYIWKPLTLGQFCYCYNPKHG